MSLKVFFYLTLASAIALGGVYYELTKSHPVPEIYEQYWGPGESKKIDTSIRPFKIEFTNKMVEDLKLRLNNVRLTPPLENAAQEYGMNTDLLKEILDFWKTKYNFKERENYLNKYPQYKTNIQGLDIHYIHVKPKPQNGVTSIPLMILHGWPGSVREFYELIPFLTTPRKEHNFVFELVIPSLPGYGFSDGARKQGLGSKEIALILKTLMGRLGFNQFYLQGGDWGSIIASDMSMLFKDNVKGFHNNFCMVSTPLAMTKRIMGSFYPDLLVDPKYAERMYPLGEFFSRMMLESGYFHIQATKPDSIGVGLGDSPAGLAAWILEKFTTGTNAAWKSRKDGGLKELFKYEDLLDNVMMYWTNNAKTTAIRLYAEGFRFNHRVPITVPTACAQFRNELFYAPKCILQERFVNLVRVKEYDVGGHFIAFEKPQMLADDIWESIALMRKQEVN